MSFLLLLTVLWYLQSGGRQKYSDRRDRLLRILNEKKMAKQREESELAAEKTTHLGDKDIDTIMTYIDGPSLKNNKKKQKQRVKKVSL